MSSDFDKMQLNRSFMLQKKLYNFGNQIHMYMFSQNKECFKNKTVKNHNV